MNRTDLDARNAAAVRRYARHLADSDGRPPQALLDDLAAVADEHAATGTAADAASFVSGTGSVIATDAAQPPPLHAVGGTGAAATASIQGSGGSGAGVSTPGGNTTTPGGGNTPASTQRTRTRTGGTAK